MFRENISVARNEYLFFQINITMPRKSERSRKCPDFLEYSHLTFAEKMKKSRRKKRRQEKKKVSDRKIKLRRRAEKEAAEEASKVKGRNK